MLAALGATHLSLLIRVVPGTKSVLHAKKSPSRWIAVSASLKRAGDGFAGARATIPLLLGTHATGCLCLPVSPLQLLLLNSATGIALAVCRA